jgi:glutamyl-tRNA synthetase
MNKSNSSNKNLNHSEVVGHVVTRFAPSPTGFMHVGSIRTALYSWLYARKNNGIMILRIEDTDKEREVSGSIDHIIESLKWLGITWDEGPDIGGPNAPYIQSQRLDSYKKYAKILVEKGLAYADPYTEEELDNFRKKAEEEKRPFLFRDHRPENPPVWDGTQPLRLKIINIEKIKWHDLVRGELEAGPEALDDFILIKSDGYPTYNFAHIIDDFEMGVTHIFRADEFISSTPKFLALYEALEIKRPEFVTLPPIMGPDGKKKLGKRDGAKDILDYRKEGYLPEAVVNFLALIGWNPGGEKEIFTIEEIIELFEIEKIHTGGAKFNEEKLLWTNREFIKNISNEVFLKEIKNRNPDKNLELNNIENVVEIVRERISIWSDIDLMWQNGELQFFFVGPVYEKTLLFPKGIDDKSIIIKHFEKMKEILENSTNWDVDSIKTDLWDYATKVGRGNVLWPFRTCLTGLEKSPDPFTVAYILGKTETLKRIDTAINLLNK